MNLEGGYGLLIYTLIPIAFITVLGATALSNPDSSTRTRSSSRSRARSSAPAARC